jgi:hypothetical protein
MRVVIGIALVAGALAVAAPTHAAANHTYYAGDVTVVEGNSGPKSRAVYIPITLSNPGTATLTIDYTLVPVTATAGNAAPADYVHKAGTLQFKLGANGKTKIKAQVAVKIHADTEVEGDQTFEVHLSNPVGGGGGFTAGRAVGTVTIVDDDPSAGLVVSVGDASMVEGDDYNYARAMKLAISLSQPAASQVLVTWNVVSGSATCARGYYGGPTTPNQDCVLFPKNKVAKFKPGTQVTKAANVPVFVDLVAEGDETFEVQIISVTGGGATIGDGTGVGTIIDDDA